MKMKWWMECFCSHSCVTRLFAFKRISLWFWVFCCLLKACERWAFLSVMMNFQTCCFIVKPHVFNFNLLRYFCPWLKLTKHCELSLNWMMDDGWNVIFILSFWFSVLSYEVCALFCWLCCIDILLFSSCFIKCNSPRTYWTTQQVETNVENFWSQPGLFLCFS